MSWSFDPTLPTEKDRVRLAIGDTDAADELLQDETIDFALTEHGSVPWAAVACATAILARFSRNCSKAVGDLRLEAQQRRDGYAQLVETLTRAAGTRGATPFAGGISLARKEAVAADPDRPPRFTSGQFDHHK